MGALLPGVEPQGMESLNPLLFRENLCICDIPPTCGSLHWGFGSWPDCISAPPALLNVAFLLLLLFAVEELFC